MACKQCGECCKWVYVEYPHPVFLRELDILRGMEKVTDRVVRAPVMCKLYDPETHLCKDHLNKPEICKQYPTSMDYRPKECKYDAQ